MEQKLINSQLTNYKTFLLYKEMCLSLAENVFKYREMPSSINKKILNETLLSDGSIAFFEDEILGILALPYVASKLNVYNEPLEIDVIMPNNYIRHLNYGEFVILYDNNRQISIYSHVIQFAERLSNTRRVSDININQQKTPRFYSVPNGKENTFKNLINNIDGNENVVIGYEDLNIEECSCILEPAPFVTDKLDLHFDKIWQEFLSFIGISSSNLEKRERIIKDELKASLGGNLAGRFNRFESRKDGLEKINKKWNLQIKCMYYDNEPTTEDTEENREEENKNDTI